MDKILLCKGCFTSNVKPKECLEPCFHDAFQFLTNKIEDSSRQLSALIERKLPDPPLHLVHSKEVCQFVGIVARTLLRCEKLGLIRPVKKEHTGKYFLHADMVEFKKKYHRLSG